MTASRRASAFVSTASVATTASVVLASAPPLVRICNASAVKGEGKPRSPAGVAEPTKAVGTRQAGRPVGRLCDGTRLRVRLDALYRSDPGRDLGSRRLGDDGYQRRRPAGGLFRRARYSVRAGGVGGRTVRRLSRPLSRPRRQGREGDGWPAGAHRHCVPVGLDHAGQLLAARSLPGARSYRLMASLSLPRRSRAMSAATIRGSRFVWTAKTGVPV